MLYRELQGDLFQIKPQYTIVHCISADCEMGKGIAVTVSDKNPNMRQTLRNMNPKIGDALYYKGEGQHAVINLVTKNIYNHKPTRTNFNHAIINLRDLVEKQGIKQLAMPLIGSGLDKLSWKVSSLYIQNVFADLDIDIVVVIKK